MVKDSTLRGQSDEAPVRRAIRHHVAFACIIVSLLAVFAFAYAINLPAS
jgi:hypothetical protein